MWSIETKNLSTCSQTTNLHVMEAVLGWTVSVVKQCEELACLTYTQMTTKSRSSGDMTQIAPLRFNVRIIVPKRIRRKICLENHALRVRQYVCIYLSIKPTEMLKLKLLGAPTDVNSALDIWISAVVHMIPLIELKSEITSHPFALDAGTGAFSDYP